MDYKIEEREDNTGEKMDIYCYIEDVLAIMKVIAEDPERRLYKKSYIGNWRYTLLQLKLGADFDCVLHYIKGEDGQ